MKKIVQKIRRKISHRLLHPEAEISSSSSISNDTQLGQGTRIDSDVTVNRSSLGRETTVRQKCHLDQVSTENRVILYDSGVFNQVEIGSHSYIASNARINSTRIGRFCSIGPELIAGHGDHPVDWVSTSPVFFSTLMQCGISFSSQNHFDELKPITVGNDVWVGARTFIRNGTRIGNGCIVAAGAVVVSDLPDYAIAGGVPARIIRFRFPPEDVDRLNRMQWWNWNEDKLKAMQPHFLGKDIERLVGRSEEFDLQQVQA